MIEYDFDAIRARCGAVRFAPCWNHWTLARLPGGPFGGALGGGALRGEALGGEALGGRALDGAFGGVGGASSEPGEMSGLTGLWDDGSKRDGFSRFVSFMLTTQSRGRGSTFVILEIIDVLADQKVMASKSIVRL